jgi:LEA14-like dessication related protein
MLRQTTKSQMEQSFDFAHRSNIERYKKLLQTHLTEHERAFIQRRLDEERRALALLNATHVA